MILFFNIHRDYGVLPYFLRYYHARGVTRFVCGIYQGHKNKHYRDIKTKLNPYSHDLYCSYFGTLNSQRDAVAQDRKRKEILKPGQWYLVADVDEFHFHPAFETFKAMRVAASKEGVDYVGSILLDRLPVDGVIKDLDLDLTLDEQFPWAASLTENNLGGWNAKIVMARSHIPIFLGHHTTAGKRASFTCQTHHFKWQGEDLLSRLRRRSASYQRQKLAWWTESLNFLDYYRAGANHINLKDPKLRLAPAVKIGI